MSQQDIEIETYTTAAEEATTKKTKTKGKTNTAEYNKKYYQENKKHILQKIKENSAKEMTCPVCGAIIHKCSWKSHKISKLHKYILANPPTVKCRI